MLGAHFYPVAKHSHRGTTESIFRIQRPVLIQLFSAINHTDVVQVVMKKTVLGGLSAIVIIADAV